tara:strand:+ start:8900 stop:9256 length:357 start_codon:yes stop_codon:yes gene_type:complete
MKKSEHRLGVSETNLVDRHLKLVDVDTQCIALAISEIDEIYGIDEVSFDERSEVLNVAYDASRTCIDCIEDILVKHRVEVSHDWWTRFKEGHYRFVDQNVKDNAEHVPFSCHKIPPHK